MPWCDLCKSWVTCHGAKCQTKKKSRNTVRDDIGWVVPEMLIQKLSKVTLIKLGKCRESGFLFCGRKYETSARKRGCKEGHDFCRNSALKEMFGSCQLYTCSVKDKARFRGSFSWLKFSWDRDKGLCFVVVKWPTLCRLEKSPLQTYLNCNFR